MDAYLLPLVADPSNVNSTPGQKELLLWHWRLGISMSRIQELMVPHQAKDENGLQDVMPCVITPALKTATTGPIPCCVAGELACARCHPTGATKQLAVEEKAGIFVSQPISSWRSDINGSVCEWHSWSVVLWLWT
jgi:hypothetical protein